MKQALSGPLLAAALLTLSTGGCHLLYPFDDSRAGDDAAPVDALRDQPPELPADGAPGEGRPKSGT